MRTTTPLPPPPSRCCLQLQNAKHDFEQWLLEQVSVRGGVGVTHARRDTPQDFVPALYPSLFSCKHLDFLMTEVIPVMQRDRCMRALCACAQSTHPLPPHTQR